MSIKIQTLDLDTAFVIADLFAEWMLSDDSLADLEPTNHYVCSCKPSVERYKKEVGTDLYYEFLSFFSDHPTASIVPANKNDIMFIISLFEMFPLHGYGAKIAWNKQLQSFSDKGLLTVPLRLYQVPEYEKGTLPK